MDNSAHIESKQEMNTESMPDIPLNSQNPKEGVEKVLKSNKEENKRTTDAQKVIAESLHYS